MRAKTREKITKGLVIFMILVFVLSILPTVFR
nr:DUF4044 domain-containing protein [Clostridium hydrogeniformans]